MPNPAPTDVVNELASYTVSTSTVIAALDSDRDYTLLNTGLDDSGNTVATPARIGVNTDTPPADFAGGEDRIPLPAGVGVPIGPGVAKLAMAAASGVVIAIVPGPKYLGRF